MDFNSIPTPFYYVDENLLIKNLEILQSVINKTGCKILLAQKAFSMFSLYPLIGKYLHGTTASGIYEARLGHDEFGGETHVFSPAYTDAEFNEIVEICDYIVFNSFNQAQKFKSKALSNGRKCGIRINPEHSTGSHPIYDPCAPGSRLGVTLENFRPEMLKGISGLHFHTLCQQNSDALVETVKAVEKKFGNWLYEIQWLNIGGGHHITRDDYDIDLLVNCINNLKEKYNLAVYIEPGEAVVLNAGFLVASVIEIVENYIKVAILDTSAACHMPDVLEMPYRPEIIGAAEQGKKPHLYRLAGPTCLAGDIIGDYSFNKPLNLNDRLIFCDMAHYSMVKNNTFNGMPLPSVAVRKTSGEYCLVREFGYNDFKNRLS
ncbi:MAG: carboxynorspermidine decarboxylase [Defluviitaleaceae bacterium]|nr:carboxynorspermidine decarboxylase [Defluviitaleaceae bacterium]